MASEKGATSEIVIWGASGHGRVVADIVAAQARFELVGFIDDIQDAGTMVAGVPVLGNRSALDRCREQGISHLVVGLGDCRRRLELATHANALGFSLGCAIHPRAVLAKDVVVGPGSVVAGGAVINPGVTLGRNTIVNTAASVDHDCVVGDGAHVGPGARIGGRASIGRGAWIGIGAVVSDRISIGEGTIIGAGAVVVRNIPANVVAFGVPARVRRNVDLE
jgi:sugar O-acyltransferase (sialic acid O-acetyltransferase NeuD family)